jgi:hypothetical protein
MKKLSVVLKDILTQLEEKMQSTSPTQQHGLMAEDGLTKNPEAITEQSASNK